MGRPDTGEFLPAADSGQHHAALLYSSPQEFLDVALPYLDEGLQAGDRMLVVTTAANTRRLRERFPDSDRSMSYVASSSWYTSPSDTLAAYSEYIRDHEARARRVRILGEPPWPDSPLLQRSWQRYEALLNLVLAPRSALCLCPYDIGILDQSIVAGARRTHPTLMSASHRGRSPDYADPATLCTELDTAPLPRLSRSVAEFTFDASSLAQSRRHVADAARAAHLSVLAVNDLVIAVNEVTANAVRHGGGSGTLRLWHEAGYLIIEIADQGGGLPDPLVGHRRPDISCEPTAGYGLWLARQLCDLVELRPGSGLTVRLYTRIPPERHD